MPRFKMKDGAYIALSPEEELARDAEEALDAAEEPKRQAKRNRKKLRGSAEDQIEEILKHGIGFVKAKHAKIDSDNPVD